MCVFVSAHRFQRRRRKGREAGYGEQNLIRSIEKIEMRVDGAVSCRHKEGGAMCVVDGNVGLETRSAAGLLDNVRWRIDRQDVDPAQAHGGWFAGVIKTALADEA